MKSDTKRRLKTPHPYIREALGCLILCVLIFIALQSATAAKPGSTDSTSAGSLGISLTIPSTVRARPVQPATVALAIDKNHSTEYRATESHLCITAQNPGGFRYLLFKNGESVTSETLQPLPLTKSRNKALGCQLTLSYNTSQAQNSQRPLLLMVSPE